MKRRFATIGLFGIVIAVSVAAQPTPPLNIKGVWRVTEQTINQRTLTGEQLGVGYHIYTDKFYAAVRESDVPPRPQVADLDKATARQIIEMWGPFVAQLGTYEISGDRIIHTTLVAKNPANQREGGPGQRIRMDGNMLIAEPVERLAGQRQITLKMVRVE